MGTWDRITSSVWNPEQSLGLILCHIRQTATAASSELLFRSTWGHLWILLKQALSKKPCSKSGPSCPRNIHLLSLPKAPAEDTRVSTLLAPGVQRLWVFLPSLEMDKAKHSWTKASWKTLFAFRHIQQQQWQQNVGKRMFYVVSWLHLAEIENKSS